MVQTSPPPTLPKLQGNLGSVESKRNTGHVWSSHSTLEVAKSQANCPFPQPMHSITNMNNRDRILVSSCTLKTPLAVPLPPDPDPDPPPDPDPDPDPDPELNCASHVSLNVQHTEFLLSAVAARPSLALL